jgi:hypothetical protein
MNPIVRALGKVLRLVGISSPEDSVPKPRPRTAADPPSWRNPSPPKPGEGPR